MQALVNRIAVYFHFLTKNMVCPLYRGKFGLNFSSGAKRLCPL